MTRYAQQERHALGDSLLALGPDTPTLDEPWRARDLAAHLVIRDARPDLAIGMFVPALKGRLDAGMRSYAARDYPALVEQVRSGPPVWSPARVPALDEAVNLGEFFIHHEDLLRGAPGFTPRVLDAGLEAALWKGLRTMSKLFLGKSPVGVELVAPGHGHLDAKMVSGAETAVVTGTPGELTLFISGRQRVSDVSLGGPRSAQDAIREASLGG
ncbi:MAG: TIGR03085 family metal-binding protein [Actinomycetota bacterium]|nr:TIGR03085 family metal-binding protein [Actinomycetota bacterium]